MSYLEELLPEFRNGAKIRLIGSRDNEYYYIKHNVIYNQNGTPIKDFSLSIILADVWEFYQEPIDWNYIVKNKCLCWFSDEDIEEPNFADRLLAVVENESGVKYMTEGKVTFAYCRPVRKDEVTFYEDKRDD
jgi:hypothetical protein